MAIGWAAAVGLLYYAFRRNGRGAWVVGGLVVSHWVLDFLVHRPDLPLWPGGSKYGLGLWNSWTASICVELLVFGAGVSLYGSSTRSRDFVGRYGYWALVIFLFLGWIGAIFGPPPPSVHSLAVGGLTMWLLVPWAWWADQHREWTGGNKLRPSPASANHAEV